MTLRTFREHSALKWLYPGMHIKRWLALLLFGISLMGLGIAYVLKEAYLQAELPGIFYYLTLQFIPRWGRGVLFMTLSLSTVGLAVYKLNQSLLFAFVRPDHRGEGGLAEAIYNKRFLQRGPRIVAIGGGTGLSTLLRGLKTYTSNLTAIVTVADDGGSTGVLRQEFGVVADDGGSTGVLRQEFGVVAPGDLRQCIAALAEAEPLMSRLFQYRFTEGTGLEGHSFGNLFIVAMAEVTGNFETAIHEASRVLNVRGTILPSTLEDVTLSARTHEDEIVHGEHNITEHGARIRDLYLNPADADAHPDAVRAILDADMVVIGPGSLYTSVMPNLLVGGIQKALFQTSAMKLFICNVATQHGETDNFSVADHIETLERHTGKGILNAVLANNNISDALPEAWHSSPVPISNDGLRAFEGLRLIQADVVAEANRYRHDPDKLAACIMRVYDERDILSLEQRPSAQEASLAASR